LDSLKKLIDDFSNDPRVKRYKELEGIINNSRELKVLFSDLKRKQKKVVNNTHYGIEDKASEEAMKAAQDALMEYPLMSEYLDIIDELNQDIQAITHMIESSINEDLERS
jgi:cell fate (sporulation/competence/biofilm development) regulator YmcA (YheA/YmcA/DUF963 family)